MRETVELWNLRIAPEGDGYVQFFFKSRSGKEYLLWVERLPTAPWHKGECKCSGRLTHMLSQESCDRYFKMGGRAGPGGKKINVPLSICACRGKFLE